MEERRRAIEVAEQQTRALLLKAFQRAIDGAPPARWPKSPRSCAALSRSSLNGAYPELGVRSFGKGTFHKPDLPGAEAGQKLFRSALVTSCSATS